MSEEILSKDRDILCSVRAGTYAIKLFGPLDSFTLATFETLLLVKVLLNLWHESPTKKTIWK
jgi:hypothetical protein